MVASHRPALVAAARRLIVERGYGDTSVDDVCRQAGVTKGSFFHHFKTKEDVAAAAILDFVEETMAWQAAAPGAADPDPLARALAFIDHNLRFAAESPPEPFGCILGTVAAELAESRPALRDAAAAGMRRWTAPLERDLAEAARARGLRLDAAALADHFGHAFQGGVVLARARQDPAALAESLGHYRRYVEMTFAAPAPRGRGTRTRGPPGNPGNPRHP